MKSLKCGQCDTEVSGQYALPVLLQLSVEEQAFIFDFVQSSGSLKLMAQKLGLSYPTVRNMLDDLIARMEALQATAQKQTQ